MIVDANLPQKEIVEIETKLGGEYNIESVINDDGTQTLNIISAGKAFDRLQWKCDNIKNLSGEFENYKGTSLDVVLNGLGTGNVTNMERTFLDCKALTSIPLLDTSNVDNMKDMFKRCYELTSIPLLDTSNVNNMEAMFSYCQKLTSIPLLDTSNVTNMGYMFDYCRKLTSIPQLNTSNVDNMQYMFQSCDELTSIPLLDTSNVTNMQDMFIYCKKLTSIPLIDTSNVTNMKYTFRECKALTSIPQFNTSNVADMQCTFYLSGLTECPVLDTSNVKQFYGTFDTCQSLVTVHGLDLINATNVNYIFSNCKKLANLTLKNIKISLTIGSGITYGHLLTLDSLINTIKELWDFSSGTSTKKLTIGSANLEKIANTYVKLITATEEMIANDPNIESKMPCELCESTEEGAMLITDYATLKKWTIA